MLNALFNEELGGVLQVRADRVEEVVAQMRAEGLAHCTYFIGETIEADELRFEHEARRLPPSRA